jgi:hypothetical protein
VSTCSPGLPRQPCLLCFQLTLTIVRQTGGLGISIAGGKGSTPYKGDDEVSSYPAVHWAQLPLSSLLSAPAAQSLPITLRGPLESCLLDV